MNFDNIVITSIKESSTNTLHKGGPYQSVNRKNYALVFCQTGQMTYTMNGKDFVCDQSHALLLPKGSDYSFVIDKLTVLNVVNFYCDGIDCEEIEIFLINDLQSYVDDCEKIKALCTFSDNRLAILSITYKILDRLSKGPLPEKNILYPAIQYLEKNIFSPDLSNFALAKKANISEVYFRKLFIEKYGTTPKQYILDVRMNKAKQLLRNSNLTVTEVAFACGFSSLYSFSRAFKDKTGKTPTSYSKKHKNLSI